MSLASKSKAWMISLVVAWLLALGCVAQANEQLQGMAEDPNQWVMPGGDYSLTRFSKLDQINADNAKDLKVAWTISTGTLRGHEGQPLVVGDMMYFESAYPNYIYAVNLDNIGRIVWRFAPPKNSNAPPVACCDVVNRGVSYSDGKIFASILDGHIYALDAKTGKVIWTALNADPLKGQTVTTAPVVVKDKLIIGVSGGEYGVLGYLSAFDLKTGKLAWRAYSAGSDEAMIFDPAKTINANLQQPVGKDSSIKTWSGDQWKLGGGTTWGWYSYDPKLNLIYYGTGNPGSWNPTQRPGDNRWSMSIIARNPDTGMAAWAFQLTPHDGWDYDGVNENVLFDATIGGQQSPALAHFDRNGYGYVLERDNGKLLAVHKYDPTVNWATSIDVTTGKPEVDPTKMTKAGVNVKNICPAAEGDKDEQPSSYDPMTHLFYVPTNHICMDYQAFDVKYKAGFPFVGALLNMYPASPDVRGRFIAFDAVSGETKWAIDDMFQDWSGALSTAGGVAFYGTLDGWFRAVDLNDGKILYQFHCPSGIVGNPMTFMHGGKQYVAVLTGVGGWAAIGLAADLTKSSEGLGAVGLTATLGDYTNLGGVLMVFAL
jgi:PQQ-dependent dehydrogenase (methanol/ethanol family)